MHALPRCRRLPGPEHRRRDQYQLGAGIDPSSPQFQAAGKACRRYFPAPHLSQAQIAQHEESLLKFARCMRKNGAPNYPDPKFAANGAVTEGGLDPNLPNLQAAANACGG